MTAFAAAIHALNPASTQPPPGSPAQHLLETPAYIEEQSHIARQKARAFIVDQNKHTSYYGVSKWTRGASLSVKTRMRKPVSAARRRRASSASLGGILAWKSKIGAHSALIYGDALRIAEGIIIGSDQVIPPRNLAIQTQMLEIWDQDRRVGADCFSNADYCRAFQKVNSQALNCWDSAEEVVEVRLVLILILVAILILSILQRFQGAGRASDDSVDDRSYEGPCVLRVHDVQGLQRWESKMAQQGDVSR